MILLKRLKRGFGPNRLIRWTAVKTVSMTQLHRNFSRLVAQAAAGETILVTRNGKDLCRLRPLDEAEMQDSPSASDGDATIGTKA